MMKVLNKNLPLSFGNCVVYYISQNTTVLVYMLLATINSIGVMGAQIIKIYAI